MFYYYIFIVNIIGLLLIIINIILSLNNKYIEKEGPFECGFTSFQQTRNSINISFIIIAILFLPFDLEITSILPYVISNYNTSIYGLIILIIYLTILIIGFIFEINLNIIKLKYKINKKVKPLIKYIHLNKLLFI